MSFSYDIDENRMLAVIRFVGPVTVAEKIASDEIMLSDPKFRRGMSGICDLSRAVFDWKLEDIDRLRTYVRSSRERIGHSRWAIAVTGGTTDFTARIFTLLHDIYDDNITIQLFRNVAGAEAWLAERIEEQDDADEPSGASVPRSSFRRRP